MKYFFNFVGAISEFLDQLSHSETGDMDCGPGEAKG